MITLRRNQKPVYDKLMKLLKCNDTVLFAAITGFGKTPVMGYIVEQFEGKRILIITHGTTVIRDNASKSFGELDLDRKFLTVKAGRADLMNDFEVCVALPQSISHRLDELHTFDYILVDEAHEFYGTDEEKKMYHKILKWHKGKVILFTASHYKLKVPKVFYSKEDAYRDGVISEVEYHLYKTKVNFSSSDYNAEHDLTNESVRMRTLNRDTKGMAKEIIKRTNGPTMIATAGIAEANEMYRYLKRAKIDARVSHSGDINGDKDSKNVADFQEGKFQVLIVVNRGILGFSYDELRAVIDLTYSNNIANIEQMLGRLCRIEKGFTGRPIFYKFAPSDDQGYRVSELISGAVLALGARVNYESWDGRYTTATYNPKDVPEPKEKTEGGGEKEIGATKTRAAGLIQIFGPIDTLLKGDDPKYANVSEAIREANGFIVWDWDKAVKEGKRLVAEGVTTFRGESSYRWVVRQRRAEEWFNEIGYSVRNTWTDIEILEEEKRAQEKGVSLSMLNKKAYDVGLKRDLIKTRGQGVSRLDDKQLKAIQDKANLLGLSLYNYDRTAYLSAKNRKWFKPFFRKGENQGRKVTDLVTIWKSRAECQREVGPGVADAIRAKRPYKGVLYYYVDEAPKKKAKKSIKKEK